MGTPGKKIIRATNLGGSGLKSGRIVGRVRFSKKNTFMRTFHQRDLSYPRRTHLSVPFPEARIEKGLRAVYFILDQEPEKCPSMSIVRSLAPEHQFENVAKLFQVTR